jgi:hypothetical protein
MRGPASVYPLTICCIVAHICSAAGWLRCDASIIISAGGWDIFDEAPQVPAAGEQSGRGHCNCSQTRCAVEWIAALAPQHEWQQEEQRTDCGYNGQRQQNPSPCKNDAAYKPQQRRETDNRRPLYFSPPA